MLRSQSLELSQCRDASIVVSVDLEDTIEG
jgi:hypothetical protein